MAASAPVDRRDVPGRVSRRLDGNFSPVPRRQFVGNQYGDALKDAVSDWLSALHV